MSALRIAKGIADRIDGRIAVIDTEARSASKYADRISFDVDDLGKKNIENYIQSMEYAVQAGYQVLVIDSLSHAWQELLEEVDRIAKASASKNSWAAWSEGTPKQKKLINTILNFPGHIIVTMRSKIEWELVEEKGKKTPKKQGLAPEQGKGIEYEFDMLVEINQDHFATITKDRTGKFQDAIIEKPDDKFGSELYDWLNAGAAPPPVIKSKEQLAEEYKAERDELKNIMSTTFEEDKPVFSPEEYAAVGETLSMLKGKSAEEHLETINLILAEKKAVLMERMNNRLTTTVSSGTDMQPPNLSVGPEESKQKENVPAMYQEKESEETAAESESREDDGFDDDIPFGDATEDSFSEGFQKYRKEKHSVKTAKAGEELDIF
jgi:hypothetical protein